MAPEISIISQLPGLQEWIVGRSWKGSFDPMNLRRSVAYCSERFIKQIVVMDDGSGESAAVTAYIHGNAPKPYHTDIVFRRVKGKWTVDPDCSCPVGFHCKHSAALLAWLAGALARAAQSAPRHLSLELDHWLREVESAASARAAPGPVPVAKPENRFLAYCIERFSSQAAARPVFVLRVGTWQKDGTVRMSETRSLGDLSDPPKYMALDDFAVVTLYHRRRRNHPSWGGELPLEGTEWDDLLAAALATGRLFFGNPLVRDAYQPVTPGPPLRVDATWETAPSGSATPVLRCENPDFIVMATEPPRYLDPATATLGVLTSELPASLLGAWQNGPAVSANNLPVIAKRLAAISTANLPTPAKIATESCVPSSPLPHFRIYSRSLGQRWDLQKYIVGHLSFRYSDSKLLEPLAKGHPQTHSELRGGVRVVWPRDFEAEQAHWARLRKSGFISLSGIMSPTLLDTAALHSFVPEEASPSQQLAWLALLDSPVIEKLRADGWNIEIDPKAGLTAHDAGEFFPAIEADPDHGIDWFRFEISFELNGKQVSLIPIIAQAIRMDLPAADAPGFPEFFALPCENPEDGFIRFPTLRLIGIVDQVRHLFHGNQGDGPIRIDRIAAAGVADTLAVDTSETTRALAKLGHSLRNITSLPPAEIPTTVRAELRHYQLEGYRWLQFLAGHGLNGILADDMGLGKTVQTLAHLAAEREKQSRLPSLVIAPTSVVPNWTAEAEKFTPHLKVLTLQGKDRATGFAEIAAADIVLTSYPLLTRDFDELVRQKWHVVVLDEAQYIKNPKALSAQNACKLKSAHRLCLSGTPMENHLGELWSLMRFLMPGFLGDEKSFNSHVRRPIERERSADAQLVLNRRVSPLILRRTKDQVATELPAKTVLIHGIDLTKKQTDLYEAVRAAMDKRVRDAIAAQGLAKSHIVVLDALLKLRQICCHPQLLKSAAAQKVAESAKLAYLCDELLPTLLEEGRRILLFSTFTSMLALIEKHLLGENIPYLKLTGQTQDRASLVGKFQTGAFPIFLISLKAGGTGLNLTAADTVIHYDPWWNPAAENQATDRAHRIGQTKPVFVHKLVCRGTIEDRILELQKHKASLVEALLSDETGKLRIDAETLSHLLAPLE